MHGRYLDRGFKIGFHASLLHGCAVSRFKAPYVEQETA